MCTVTFWPGESGFIMTSNRDEHASRNARRLHHQITDNNEIVYFPQDELRGGSWFAASTDGKCGCILNGAFEPYDVHKQWPESRGQMLLEFFNYRDRDAFADTFDFEKVAPFTFVLFQDQLEEWKFDGQKLHRRSLDTDQRHIWSSVTLYPKEVRMARRQAFLKFQEVYPKPSSGELMNFHSSQPFGDGENDFIMDRQGKVQTVSITQFNSMKDPRLIHHKDLMSGIDTKLEFKK